MKKDKISRKINNLNKKSASFLMVVVIVLIVALFFIIVMVLISDKIGFSPTTQFSANACEELGGICIPIDECSEGPEQTDYQQRINLCEKASAKLKDNSNIKNSVMICCTKK